MLASSQDFGVEVCFTVRIPWETQKGLHFPYSKDKNGNSSALYTLVLKVGEGGHSGMNYFIGHDGR